MVELRERVGDWEGDLVVGCGNKSAVATLVDRRTRLLRQYLPNGTDLSVHTPEDLRAIEERLNTGPRKALGWRAPAHAFAAALTA